MTVTYTPIVSNISNFCIFRKALRMYRGSVYKIVWRELLFFIFIYLTIQFITIFVFSKPQQLAFKRIRDSFYIKRKCIPLHYVLGFFVILVVSRWSFLQQSIPSADTFSILLNSAISSNSERSRLMRRAAVRYVIASFIINLRVISLKMRNRFPTYQSIVNLGILLKNEGEILEKIEERTSATTYVIPLVWATNIINRARNEGLINNDCIVQDLLTELGNYRNKLGDLLSYDLVCIPLFYIQVVTLSIYSYIISTIIGNQVCCEDDVPLMEIAVSLIAFSLEFTFHVGWVKVTEVMLNPFGEDDEDFDVDEMVDRNHKAANMIVDYMRVKESHFHPREYHVYYNVSNDLNENKSSEDHVYCSIEEDVETQTEDQYFQMYENVPVTSPPLELLTPSLSSSCVDYVNVIVKNTPTGGKDAETQTEDKYFQTCENVPVASPPVQLQTPSPSSSDVDNVNVIFKNTHTVEEGVENQTKYKYFQMYEYIPETSPQFQLQTPSQSSSYGDCVNVIVKNATTVEEGVENQTEDNYFQTYEYISGTSPQLQLQTPSESSAYIDHVNVIIKNPPTVEEGVKNQTEDNYFEMYEYESIPETSPQSQLQTPPQTSSNVVYANVIHKSPHTDEPIYSEIDAITVEESNAHENIPPKTKKNFLKRFFLTKFKLNKKK